ncbi:unnamed protein product [Closterium sp. Naga37s-1]|nr:unnamed protein product [Closterium sp. Naga37s-1]
MESWDPKKVQHLIARSPPHRPSPFPSYLSSSFPSSLSSSLSSHLALLLSSLSRYAHALDAWWGTVAEETFNLSEEFKYVGWPGNYGKAAGGVAGGSPVGATGASAGDGGAGGGAGMGVGRGVEGGVAGVNVWRRVKKYRHFVAFMAVVAAVNGLFSLLLIDSLLSGACIPLFHDCHTRSHIRSLSYPPSRPTPWWQQSTASSLCSSSTRSSRVPASPSSTTAIHALTSVPSHIPLPVPPLCGAVVAAVNGLFSLLLIDSLLSGACIPLFHDCHAHPLSHAAATLRMCKRNVCSLPHPLPPLSSPTTPPIIHIGHIPSRLSLTPPSSPLSLSSPSCPPTTFTAPIPSARAVHPRSNINHTRHAASLRSLHQPYSTGVHHSAHSSSSRQSLLQQQQQDELQSEGGYQEGQGGEEENQEDGSDMPMHHDRNKDGNDGIGGSDGSQDNDDESSGSKDGRAGDDTHSSAGLSASAASAAFFLSRLARSPGVHVTPYPDVPGAYILQTPSTTPTPTPSSSSSSSSSSSAHLQDAITDPSLDPTSSTVPHPTPRCALLLRDVCYVHMQGASRLHRSSAGVWFDREALESALAGDLGGQAIHAASDLSKINLGLVQQCAAGEGGGAGGGDLSASGTGRGTGGDGSSSSGSSEVADVDSIAEVLYEKMGGFLSADEMAFYAASSASHGKQIFRSSALSPPPALPLAVVLPSAGRQSEFADLADALHDVALHLPTISKPSSHHQRSYHMAGSIKIKGLQDSGSSSVDSASTSAGTAGADAAVAAAGTTASAPEDTESSTGPHLFLPSTARPPNLWVGGATRLLLGPQALALPGRRVGQVKCFQNAVFIPGREQKTRSLWAVEAIRERAWQMVDDVESLVSKSLWGGRKLGVARTLQAQAQIELNRDLKRLKTFFKEMRKRTGRFHHVTVLASDGQGGRIKEGEGKTRGDGEGERDADGDGNGEGDEGERDAGMANAEGVAELVRAMMPKLTVDVVMLSNRSFIEQVAIMKRTALLIAMHGPSLANTLFLPPNATLLELFPPHLHSPQHSSLAAASHVHYYSWQNAHPLNTTYTSDCMARGQYALLPAALCAGKPECLACVRDRSMTAVHLGELRGVLRKIQQPLRAFFLAAQHRHRRRGIMYGSSSS